MPAKAGIQAEADTFQFRLIPAAAWEFRTWRTSRQWHPAQDFVGNP
jgi:hypothetical protein